MLEVDAGRNATPPPQATSASDLQLTPEQVKRVEINRLKGMYYSLIHGKIFRCQLSQGQATPEGARSNHFYYGKYA